MNAQINLRLPDNIINEAKTYAQTHGFTTVQEFIKETLREKLFDTEKMTKEEVKLVSQILDVSNNKNLYGTEEELLTELDR